MRTNQFNFTTIRRDESEVPALLETGRHDIRTVRVRDRFGDYGLVGLLIAERTDHELRADTFLMSCRRARPRCRASHDGCSSDGWRRATGSSPSGFDSIRRSAMPGAGVPRDARARGSARRVGRTGLRVQRRRSPCRVSARRDRSRPRGRRGRGANDVATANGPLGERSYQPEVGARQRTRESQIARTAVVVGDTGRDRRRDRRSRGNLHLGDGNRRVARSGRDDGARGVRRRAWAFRSTKSAPPTDSRHSAARPSASSRSRLP